MRLVNGRAARRGAEMNNPIWEFMRKNFRSDQTGEHVQEWEVLGALVRWMSKEDQIKFLKHFIENENEVISEYTRSLAIYHFPELKERLS